MLRNANLIPLSHQHQHALALCVRIGRDLRTGLLDLEQWQVEISQIYETEIKFHFAVEEKVLFPAAEKLSPLLPYVTRLRAEHETLRGFFEMAKVRKLDLASIQTFAESLSQHVRTEEREFFEQLQQLMTAAKLTRLGARLEKFFRRSGMPGTTCELRRQPQD